MLLIFLCISSLSAEGCASNQYWDPTTPTCKNCPEECATCYSSTQCTSCNSPYILDIDYQCKEKPKIDNCKTLDGMYCVECNPTYYLQGNACHQCTVANCNQCNVAKCFKCQDTYTLYEQKDEEGNVILQECIQCSDSKNDEKCGRCKLGTFFNEQTFTCDDCRIDTIEIDGIETEFKCRRCTTASNCYLCGENSALATPGDPNSTCVKIEHCVDGHYYGNHCELCDVGFYVVEGFCESCGENCARCLNDQKCVECKQGSILNNGKCNQIQNCSRTSDLVGCIECNDNFYLTAENECEKCDESCFNCLNKDTCLSCAENYYFDDITLGKCKQMDVNTCKATDQYGCLSCNSEIQYDDVMKNEKLKETIENVIEDLSSSTKYESYSFGFYLGYEYNEEMKKVIYDKECSMCNERCIMCEHHRDWCTACNDGYEIEVNCTASYLYSTQFLGIDPSEFTINMNGPCTKEEIESKGGVAIFSCGDLTQECEEATMGYCVKCIDSHFLSDVKCISCNETCGSCTSQDYCLTCNSTTNPETGEPFYWRKESITKLEGNQKGMCIDVAASRLNENELKYCKEGQVTEKGCTQCEETYYVKDGCCVPCGHGCTQCAEKDDGSVYCTGCKDEIEFLDGEKCAECSSIEHCAVCNKNGCSECEEDYTLENGECTTVPLEIIIPSVAAGLLIIIVIIIIIIVLIWRQRRKEMAKREKEIKPFKVSSEVEMALLSADNDNFPLKTSTWTLDFGHAGSKVNIDQEYEQIVQIVNTSKKSYFFEVLAGASHRYDLKADPMRYTLKPDTGIEVKFTIKMLCTAIVKDEIGIVAMDMGEELKETAKLTILIESDLSMKLDHTELKLQMPAIGEGAFGMVFVGTYRGQKVAVKKMKARNLTEEQEKEFKHEVNMLTQYRHACIVNLVGAVYTEGEISIVTEFADYSSLSKIWGKGHNVSYELKIKIMEDAVVALAFLHENQIIHRDVKGENVLVYSLNPHSPVCGKLTDFGTCRNISERALQQKALSTGIGTPTYMAPECLGNLNYTFSADVYSFAIVLYETFNERNAYENDERFNQPWMIPQFVIEEKRLERPEGMDDGYWNLIEQCWSHQPEQRPTFPQIYQTLASWGLDICHTEMNSKVVSLAEAPAEVVTHQGSSSSSDDEE